MPRFFLEDLFHLPELMAPLLSLWVVPHALNTLECRRQTGPVRCALGNTHGGGHATRAGRPCSLRELPANARCDHLRIQEEWWRRFPRISTKFNCLCSGQAPRDGSHLTKPTRLPSCPGRTAEPRPETRPRNHNHAQSALPVSDALQRSKNVHGGTTSDASRRKRPTASAPPPARQSSSFPLGRASAGGPGRLTRPAGTSRRPCPSARPSARSRRGRRRRPPPGTTAPPPDAQ